jgi:hypothetical protein
MGKRLTATEKWDKAWFRKLSPRHKALWQFLTDRCDQAGMWEVDFESASHFINDVTPITEEDLKVFGNRLEKFSNDKIWIVDFISFQCGDLSEKSPAHRPVFKLLKKYNLLDRVLRSLQCRVQEIEIEIEKELEPEKEEEKETYGQKTENFVFVKKVYAHEKIKVIYDLQLFFSARGQLESFKRAGMDKFEEFMKANPANSFKDENHLYNSFRRFCVTDQLKLVAAKATSKKKFTTLKDLDQ